MLNASVRNKPKTRPFSSWLVVVHVVVIAIVVDSALLLSAASPWNWIRAAVTVFSAALIIAGTLFTAVEMHKLAGRV